MRFSFNHPKSFKKNSWLSSQDCDSVCEVESAPQEEVVEDQEETPEKQAKTLGHTLKSQESVRRPSGPN